MAEVTGLRNNALPYPIYGAPFGVSFPLLDADGDPISPSSPDSERSLNGDTFADCTNEAVEIATSSGICYLLLTAAELTADVTTVQIKSTGAKTTVLSLYPRKLVTIRSGTSASGGSATSTIVLDGSASTVDDFYNGMVCIATIDSNVEARVISDYTGSSQTATVVPDWNVAPDNNDTFIIKLPEGVQLNQANATAWLGTLVATPATAGIPDVNTKNINNAAAATPGASGGILISGSNSGTTTLGALTVTGATTLAALSMTTLTASGAVALQSTLAVTGTTTLAAVNTGAIAATTFATSGTMTLNALTVSNATTLTGAVALGSTLVVAGTTTLAAVNAGNVITGTVGTGVFTTTGDHTITGAFFITGNIIAHLGGNVTGSVGSVLGAVGSVTGAVGSVTGAVGSVTAGVTLAASAVTAIWAYVITGTTTAVEAMRGFIAAMLGKASGLPTAPKYRDIADTKNVIDATTDTDGNRTAVTLDLT